MVIPGENACGPTPIAMCSLAAPTATWSREWMGLFVLCSAFSLCDQPGGDPKHSVGIGCMGSSPNGRPRTYMNMHREVDAWGACTLSMRLYISCEVFFWRWRRQRHYEPGPSHTQPSLHPQAHTHFTHSKYCAFTSTHCMHVHNPHHSTVTL